MRFVNVRSTLLADAPRHRPFVDAYTSERLGWVSTGAVHSFDRFPPPDSFPVLLAEFADYRRQGGEDG